MFAPALQRLARAYEPDADRRLDELEAMPASSDQETP
jgi:hypothetical protein